MKESITAEWAEVTCAVRTGMMHRKQGQCAPCDARGASLYPEASVVAARAQLLAQFRAARQERIRGVKWVFAGLTYREKGEESGRQEV